MKKVAPPTSFGAIAEKPVKESAYLRQVPQLDKASLDFHGGLTAKQEHFSLKSASERFKKRTGP
jgi:hypothetical protein